MKMMPLVQVLEQVEVLHLLPQMTLQKMPLNLPQMMLPH
jgi:hypothetical protein